MTIANELSSEVATALLEAHKKDELSAEPCNIRDVIVAVHSTLRKLKTESRRADGQAARESSTGSGGSSSAASGSH